MAFDISTERDDAGAGTTVPAPGPRARWPTRVADRWRAASRHQRRLTAGVAAGVAVVLVGGVVAGAAVASHRHDEQLRAAPGGVLSLDGELAEMWRVEAEGGVHAVLAGGAVVLVDGRDAVAREVASGAERWRVTLGAGVRCGPAPRWESSVEWVLPSDLVTCVHGDDDGRSVTVLDGSGDVVGQRALPAAGYGGEDVEVAPAADGGLLVVEHDTGMPAVLDHATVAEAEDAVAGIVTGRASVRVEDAVSGELRFEVPTREHSAENLEVCIVPWDLSAGWSTSFDPATPVRLEVMGGTEVVASPTVVGYRWCGVGGASTTDGVAPGGSRDDVGTSTVPYPGGGWLAPADDGPGRVLLAEDGSVRLVAARGTVLTDPTAVLDGGDPAVLATKGNAVVRLDAGGEELWRADVRESQLLAHVGDVVVVVTDEELVAVDALDGGERWRVRFFDGQTSRVAWATSAVTDGERVTVALRTYPVGDDGEAAGELLTADLASGAVTWTSLGPTATPFVAAVGGHVVLQHELGWEDWDGGDEPSVTSVSILAPR